MIDLAKATRYIAVAQFSKITRDEWKASHPTYPLPPDEWKDYALLKVLDMLRRSTTNKKIAIHPFQHEEEVIGLDFSKLQETDVIFVVGHGDHSGLYALGPKSREGMKRLVAILTKDGNLRRLRNGKKIVIALLSCRAGLGLHSFLSHSLDKNIAVQTIVCGAQGFTFGSIRTSTNAANEALIRGIPWFMEYEKSITQLDAENATTEREGKTITVAAKQAEIDEFVRAVSANLAAAAQPMMWASELARRAREWFGVDAAIDDAQAFMAQLRALGHPLDSFDEGDDFVTKSTWGAGAPAAAARCRCPAARIRRTGGHGHRAG